MGNPPGALTDPQATFTHWLSRDEFTIRRKVRVTTTPRKFAPKKYKLYGVLRELKFKAAHSWPLSWGGPEVTEAVFWAHPSINLEIQKRVETAGTRFAKRLQGTGQELYITVASRRYIELNLLESITYQFEAVNPAVKDGRTFLGDVTIGQNLSQAQRDALVAGEKIEIDPAEIKTVEGKVFTDKLDELVEGLRTTGSKTSSRAKPPSTPRSEAIGGRGTDPVSRAVENKTAGRAKEPASVKRVQLKPRSVDLPPSKPRTRMQPRGRITRGIGRDVIETGFSLILEDVLMFLWDRFERWVRDEPDHIEFMLSNGMRRLEPTIRDRLQKVSNIDYYLNTYPNKTIYVHINIEWTALHRAGETAFGGMQLRNLWVDITEQNKCDTYEGWPIKFTETWESPPPAYLKRFYKKPSVRCTMIITTSCVFSELLEFEVRRTDEKPVHHNLTNWGGWEGKWIVYRSFRSNPDLVFWVNLQIAIELLPNVGRHLSIIEVTDDKHEFSRKSVKYTWDGASLNLKILSHDETLRYYMFVVPSKPRTLTGTWRAEGEPNHPNPTTVKQSGTMVWLKTDN